MKLFSLDGKDISTEMEVFDTPVTPPEPLPDALAHSASSADPGADEKSQNQAAENQAAENQNQNTENQSQGKPKENSPSSSAPAFKVHDRRFWNLSEDDLDKDEQPRSQLPTFVENLQTQLNEKDRQLREYIGAYKKEVGENLEKTKQRLEREAAMRLELQRGQVLLPMVEVLDMLELSLSAAQSSDNIESLRTGFKMVHLLMIQKLQELGLQRIATVGHPFEPSLHEALTVQAVEDPAQDNIVLQELKPGFLLGDRVLRAAQVQVGKRSA